MDRSNLIAQLVVLKMSHVPTGETIGQLCKHFQAELDHGEIVYMEEDGKITAFCDFDWTEMEGGPLLHVINLVCTQPGQIWKIRQLLPKSRWITGEHEGKLHAPKGLPSSHLVEV